MIDFHCHIDLYSDPGEILRECIKRKMYVLSVTTTPSSWAKTSALSSDSRKIRTALGLHPQLATERKRELAIFDRLLTETNYVGEIGLDGGLEFRQGWEDQVTVFEHILKSCQSAGGKILSIHSRHATSEVLKLIELYPGAGVPVLHWYSGGHKELQKAVELGCWFSVGLSMISTKNGNSLVSHIPPNRVLTETDGPFVKLRGRNILPWDVGIAVKKLADIWDASFEEAQEHIKDNLRNLLTKT